MTLNETTKVAKPDHSKIAIPMHFWWEQAVQEYAQGMAKVKTLNTPILKIAKPELSAPTEVVILPWERR
jgi:hypothetical protein